MIGHARSGSAEVERRVTLRMQRQELLVRPQPTQLWAIVDEAVLRRPIGGVEVMRAQLEALIEATKLPNVRLQIMPFRSEERRVGKECGRAWAPHVDTKAR